MPPDLSSLDVTLDQALALLAQPKRGRSAGRAKAKPLRTLDASPTTGKPIELRDGRYGPYVTDGETNASLPRDVEPENVTYDLAVRLRRSAPRAGPRRSPRRKAATKKTPRKKAARKKSSRRPRPASRDPVTGVRIVGGGLAGSEAALQCARFGVPVTLHEMRPAAATPAHRTDRLGELVCSNSFKSTDVENAHGLLKAELERLGCRLLEIIRVPRTAGSALGVDRERFAELVTAAVESEPLVTVVPRGARRDRPGEVTIVASSPSRPAVAADRGHPGRPGTSPSATRSAPSSRSIGAVEGASRQPRATGRRDDYLNCPLDRPQYEAFVDGLLAAELYALKDFERDVMFFEGCLPIEEMARRGRETLRFGPFKPVRLADPHREDAHAVLQLRKENAAGTMFNLVGCQTRMRYGDQKQVFGLVPALARAEYLRHVGAPQHLPPALGRSRPVRPSEGRCVARPVLRRTADRRRRVRRVDHERPRRGVERRACPRGRSRSSRRGRP